MFQGEKVLCIIPARAGSKRFPGKNIFPLCGKPLIAWTIEAALRCPEIDHIHISTDSPEIAQLAKSFGLESNRLRPKELAQDGTTTVDAVNHEIRHFPGYTWIILLQPTSPLRSHKQISQAFEILASRKSSHSRLVSVSKLEIRSDWLFLQNSEELLQQAFPDEKPQLYVPNGAIYLCKRADLIGGYDFSCRNAVPQVLEHPSSLDIDTLEDMAKAQEIMRNLLILSNLS